jgi:hypothetical protein
VGNYIFVADIFQMELKDLSAYWEARMARLNDQLSVYPNRQTGYRLDLHKGNIFWVDTSEQPVAQAPLTVLASYAPANASLLMGWANEHLPAAVQPPALTQVPGLVTECSQDRALALTMRFAKALDFEFFFQLETEQHTLYLGLGALAPATDALPANPENPVAFVQQVFDSLYQHLLDTQASARNQMHLLLGYARTLEAQAAQAYADTAFRQPLVAASEGLFRLGRLAQKHIDTSDDSLPMDIRTETLRELRSLSQNWDRQAGAV